MTKTKQTYFLLDFDSTFITGEGLELFAEITLKDNPNKKDLMQRIISLTTEAMEGKISFAESLEQRVDLLSGDKKKVMLVGKLVKDKISKSILQNKDFFLQNKDHIYIISGGFKEFIYPVVKQFGIQSDHVLANTFLYDEKGRIIGIDKDNLLSQDRGKVKTVKSLKLNGDLYMIGDGYTDYELKRLRVVKKFIAFTENISRELVTKHADEIAPTFDEFLYVNNLPLSLSYPKNRITVLALCTLTETIKKQLTQEHYRFLKNESNNALIIYIDKPKQLTLELLQQSDRLLAVGMLQKGDKSELPAFLQRRGVAVFQEANPTKRIIDFINTGDTYKNKTLSLPAYQNFL